MTNVIRAAEPPVRVSAKDVVAAYVKGRNDLGISTPRNYRAIMGKNAKELLAKGWGPEVIIHAAQQFGASRKHPAFLAEWVRITQARWDEAEHLIRKAEGNAPFPPEVIALLTGVTKKMPKGLEE